MLWKVLAIPSKVSGQQPWELRPPCVWPVGRRWLQPEGGSTLQALSFPGIFAPRALAKALDEHATCCRCI